MPLFGPSPTFPTVNVGEYVIPSFGGTGTTNWGNGVCKFSAVFVPGGSWDRIGSEVSVAGSSDAQYRFAIYTDNGFGKPGTLVVDAGLASSTAAGASLATISVALSPGLYWLAAVSQNATTPATVRYINPSADSFKSHIGVLTNLNIPIRGWSGTVAGAFPTTPPTLSGEGNPTIVGLRRLS